MFEREREWRRADGLLDSALQFGTPLDRSKSKLTIPIATFLQIVLQLFGSLANSLPFPPIPFLSALNSYLTEAFLLILTKQGHNSIQS